MRRSRLSLPRLVLVLMLFLGLTMNLSAAPASPRQHSEPVFAEWLSGVNVGRPSNRTTVVRIAGMAMALALFIMYYKKH
jgi:hypothetical protein